jgi:hypothetical protein
VTEAGPVTAYVGVYDADGGPVGEVRYVVGHLLGRLHCGLCDVTHSPLRRRPAWDAMVGRLGVPFELLHRNELAGDVTAAVRSSGLPVVLGRRADGSLVPVLGAVELDGLHGSVDAFERALRAATDRLR